MKTRHVVKRLILSIISILALSNMDSSAYSRPPRSIRISFDYLEACELGPECKPIIISRKGGEKIELVLPELSRTSVSIWDEENYDRLAKRVSPYVPIQRTGSSEAGKQREIVLPLSKLKDGTYYIWVVGDSVGGTFQVYLKTE